MSATAIIDQMIDPARVIRELRESAGITQAEAARRVGVSRQMWWQWESGFRTPSNRTLVRMRDALVESR